MTAPPELGRPADPDRLPAVLAFRNPQRFFDEFSGFAAHFYSRKLEHWPPLFRMYHVLMELDIAVNIDDISGFFLEHEYRAGAYAHEAETFLRRIGAPETAEFLAAAIALFPNAEVPKEFAKRERLTERLVEQEPNPFATLNKNYRGALKPMYGAVQKHLRRHEGELREAIENAQRGARGKPKWLTLDAALEQKTPPDRIAGGAPKEHAALNAVSDRIQERLKAVGFDRLTRGERLFHIVWFVMDAEVTNGGIHQLLWNSGGDFAEEAKRHLDEIGASKVAASLSKASAAFPRRVIPVTQKARQRALRQEEKLAGDRFEKDWDNLDREYRKAAQRELYSKLLRWVREHPREFPEPV